MSDNIEEYSVVRAGVPPLSTEGGWAKFTMTGEPTLVGNFDMYTTATFDIINGITPVHGTIESTFFINNNDGQRPEVIIPYKNSTASKCFIPAPISEPWLFVNQPEKTTGEITFRMSPALEMPALHFSNIIRKIQIVSAKDGDGEEVTDFSMFTRMAGSAEFEYDAEKGVINSGPKVTSGTQNCGSLTFVGKLSEITLRTTSGGGDDFRVSLSGQALAPPQNLSTYYLHGPSKRLYYPLTLEKWGIAQLGA